MSPTTLIELGILTSAALGLSLLAFLFPKKRRTFIWIVAGLLLIGGIAFYSARPLIIQHQTNEAIEELNKHLIKKYPNDQWKISGRDVIDIRPAVFLHVVFKSEPTIVYEYTVQDSRIKQVYLFMLSGDNVEAANIEPQHDEGGSKQPIEE
ncbi:hypothetical protein [Pseudobacillus badius]|uniref:hypothetical protein n=1 Tax=Bacillus badius TaxID=1455 RepID=UPI0007B39D8E|nr:hypothetical protein [Bacillus badius]KZR58611.1 hypothetical protein A3781_16215 [Bacillus badius]